MAFFSVTWRIENFTMCSHKVGEYLISPAFTLPELKNIEWTLRLYPKGDNRVHKEKYISCFVNRYDKDPKKDASSVKLFISFTVVNSDSDLSVNLKNTTEIENNHAMGFPKLISHDLLQNSKGFLPNNILTIQFHICPDFDEQIEPNMMKISLSNPSQLNFVMEKCYLTETDANKKLVTHCSFLTRIPVERRIFKWNIKEFETKRQSKEKISVNLESDFQEGVKLQLVCYVKESRENDECLMIDILRKGFNIRKTFIKCEVSFLESSGIIRVTKKSERVFDHCYSRWTFSLIDGLDSSNDLINNDALKMKFEFNISYEPENVDDMKRSDSASQNEDIQNMFGDEEYADVILECSDEKQFPVHKFLLIARSPVFRAMFQGDNMEKQTGVVRMKDTDAATVQHLRYYLYHNSLPDLEYEEILKLYEVADKYLIENLKKKCAAFVKLNLTVANVLEVLILADKHQDSNLTCYIIDFLIAEMDFDSDAWKNFMKEHLILAAETMRECWLKEKASKTV